MSDPGQLSLFAPPELSEHGYAGADSWPYCSMGRRAPGAPFSDTARRPGALAWEDYAHVRYDPSSNSVGLLLDCDGGWSRVEAAIGDGRIRRPSVAAIRRSNERAFCAWFLHTPVHRYPAARPGPLKTLARVSEYYHRETGADPGYNRSLGRNPIPLAGDPAWHVEYHGDGYDLAGLGRGIPKGWRMPTVAAKVQSAEGRNCFVFLNLCKFAGSPAGRHADLSAHAVGLNAAYLNPLPVREVRHIVAHVERYRRQWEDRGWHRPDWVARQKARGKRGGQKSGAVRAGRVSTRNAYIRHKLRKCSDRAERADTVRRLAAHFGVTRRHIRRILNGHEAYTR